MIGQSWRRTRRTPNRRTWPRHVRISYRMADETVRVGEILREAGLALNMRYAWRKPSRRGNAIALGIVDIAEAIIAGGRSMGHATTCQRHKREAM